MGGGEGQGETEGEGEDGAALLRRVRVPPHLPSGTNREGPDRARHGCPAVCADGAGQGGAGERALLQPAGAVELAGVEEEGVVRDALGGVAVLRACGGGGGGGGGGGKCARAVMQANPSTRDGCFTFSDRGDPGGKRGMGGKAEVTL